MKKILYIGNSNPSSTSRHRADALGRLGHNVTLLDPYSEFRGELASRLKGILHFHTGYILLQGKVKRWLRGLDLASRQADLVWVNSGELLGKGCLELLKQLNIPIVLYNNDDPTGGRDGRRFARLLEALPLYDLCVVPREVNRSEYLQKGAKKVYRTFFSYDEKAHEPFADETMIPAKFRSDVAFIGTWMRNENRDVFLKDLVDRKLNISIWGDRWQKSPHFESLRPYYRGPAIGGRDYVAAIQGAKICIGLLSKGNRDQHTQRSVEIPFIGGLFCGERTDEHQFLLKEGQDAVFWDDSAECARLCAELLGNDERRNSMRVSGKKRIEYLNLGNEDVCGKVLAELFNQ
ncbi:MAG: glycosyltransferase family 1 protein [Chitinophagaceae bacterium]|nr:MAG: glycosyltransferase family 1 protein [Chitinophagaceae bacterium]